MSSLAAQLAKNASLNSELLSSRRKASESYLFTGREADRHDLESIHALGVNGLLQLASINPALRAYEDVLFSNAVKGVDRTLLPVEANVELDRHISNFLPMLGPYLMEAPTGKVIEWLVRRFRINEFNVDDILVLFWPYHESPHFAKMLTILHIKEQSTWRFLIPHKSAAQSVPRLSLVSEMLKNTDVARFVVALLPNALKSDHVHRTLLAFNAASLHDFILRSKSLDEGTVAFLLPALLEPLQKRPSGADAPRDSILGSYVLLSALSQKCRLAPKALRIIIGAMSSCANHVTTQQFIKAAVSVCEPQDESDDFSDATVKSILRLSSINDEVQQALVWLGVEKFIRPMLPRLLLRLHEPEAPSLIQSLMTSPKVPETVTQHISTLLMDKIIGQDSASDEPMARQLLSMIYQRYPSTVRNVGDDKVSRDNTNDAVQELLLSFSLANRCESVNGVNNILDAIVASTSIEPAARKTAVVALTNILVSNTDLEASEKDSVQSALLARVHDTETQVLDALYSNPPVINPILCANSESYIENVEGCLCNPTSKPSRSILRVHLTFLMMHFCPAVETGVKSEVFHRILFPFLLFSKPRQRATDAVWEIIATAEEQNQISNFELLTGCAGSWKEMKATEKASAIDFMTDLNSALASKIAENIFVSDNYSCHLELLLGKLGASNAHARVLGHTIVRALLGRLCGANQLDAALRVLRTMEPYQMNDTSNSFGYGGDLADPGIAADLAKNIVMKPSSRRTLDGLQTSLLVLIAQLPCPSGVTIDWFTNLPAGAVHGQANIYTDIMRTVYRFTNFPGSHSMALLRILFNNLGVDSLAFLAGIWTSSLDRDLRIASLRHTSAFLQAHCSSEQPLDFQTVLPALIFALQTLDSQGRELALECIEKLIISADKRFCAVYGLDTIYGHKSANLQFLNRDDYQKYVGSLIEHRTHVLADSGYIYVFHRERLAKAKVEKRKDAAYKDSVLCYLLSHVNSISSPEVQMRLLNIVDEVSDSLKAQLLLPLAQELGDDSHSEKLAARYGSKLESIAGSIVKSFDNSVAGNLNEHDSTLWPIFMGLLRRYFPMNTLPSPRIILMDNLKNGLFVNLTLERKIEVSNLLLDIGSNEISMHQDCKKLLTALLDDVPLVLRLLKMLQPPAPAEPARAAKRAKVVENENAETPADSLLSLNLLVEVLGTKQLPGSLELISRLLETLHHTVQYSLSTQADFSFVQQLLMSAIENAAEKITEVPNLTPSAIRLDILVDLIRAASNPQIFNQALLLMASLSRLAPESVLHNVMPIFTFMGSNVFHRDDTYSFRVVQKTIDSIIPVMVTSLKKTYSDRLALYIGAKDLLRIFTDAASHVPRHRRTNFFAHLMDVLGPQDFLAPLLMLLVEKPANRVARQNFEETRNTLSLHLSILQHYASSLQIPVLAELLRESLRLTTRVHDPENIQSTFLEVSQENTSAPVVMKRLAQSLTVLVGHAANLLATSSETGSNGQGLGELVSLLIDIVAVLGTPVPADDNVAKTARWAMGQVLNAMPAAHFIQAVRAMLDCEDPKVQTCALDLLSEHLPRVSTKTRQEISSTIKEILGSIQKLTLMMMIDDPLATSAFRSLRVICVTMSPGEESCLTNFIPILLSFTERDVMLASAITVLSPLTSRLGPRLIPHFRDIVTRCVTILRTGTKEILQDTLSVLYNLVHSIPTFWTVTELTQVIELHLHFCESSGTNHTMSALIKAIAKHAPAKTLLSSMSGLWSSLKRNTKPEVYVGYFDLLKKALHSAPRAVVLEHLRPLFKVFLEALDVVDPNAETSAIASFLEIVTKLNETSFKPVFRRLYDWAFANETEQQALSRQVSFCHVYTALLDFFKGLMTPYMSFLLQPFTNILKNFSTATVNDPSLWLSIIQCLSLSFQHDGGAFWRDDKLHQIAPTLTEQVAVCIRCNISDGKSLLPDCLNALTECVDDDPLLKTINLDILMHTRSEDPRLRLFALTCAESLWRLHGGKLLGFVAETTSFMAECAEDENDNVVKQSHQLKNAVESVAGNIDG